LSYSPNDDPLIWIQRAEQARKLAEELADPGARKTMLAVAAAYEEMAKRAEEHLKAQEPC
jgi:hypothetical protein